MDKVNTYDRNVLYDEVWKMPVVEVALKYGVSDVAIHKVCKALNVPVPPRGYWAKIRAGKKVTKPELPPSNGPATKTGIKTGSVCNEKPPQESPLYFLSEDEKQLVLSAAQEISMPDDGERLHKKIIAYKKTIKGCPAKKPEESTRSRERTEQPCLADGVSIESLPRIFRILTALYMKIEALGGSVNDDLSLQIRGERVRIDMDEGQDKVEHKLTKQEAWDLVKYQDAQKHGTWASKPQIRKYDYVYNGCLRFSIRYKSYFRDSGKTPVESRLGDMFIALYEESEIVKQERMAREEAEQKREEEARLREDRRKRYNEEIVHMKALFNLSLDYDTACKIRAYVSIVESNAESDVSEWVDWAKKKADWYDPTIARSDEYFGRREHEKDESCKQLRERYSSYW